MYMHKEFARAALNLLTQARVNVDDQSLAVAQQVRAWLKAIASGAAVVSVAPEVGKLPTDASTSSEQPPAAAAAPATPE